LSPINPGSTVFTDNNSRYMPMMAEYAHEIIDKTEGYVNGHVHVNGIENFWSCLKRTIGGTYVSVEPFHLFRYLDEQMYRYNNRGKELTDADRFVGVLHNVGGRRLTYKELTGKNTDQNS